MFWHFCENPSRFGEIVSPWKASSHALKRFSKCEKETCGSEASLWVVTGNFCCPTVSSCGHRLFLVPELLLPSATWCWTGHTFLTAAQKVRERQFLCVFCDTGLVIPISEPGICGAKRCTKGARHTVQRGEEVGLQLAPSQVNSVGCGQEGLKSFQPGKLNNIILKLS